MSEHLPDYFTSFWTNCFRPDIEHFQKQVYRYETLNTFRNKFLVYLFFLVLLDCVVTALYFIFFLRKGRCYVISYVYGLLHHIWLNMCFRIPCHLREVVFD